MRFPKLFSPMQINHYTYKNRIVSAPMTFGLLALNPETRDSQLQKLESRAAGGAAAVVVGEVDVNYTDADRIPVPYCDFSRYDTEEFQVIRSVADLIHSHNAIAIQELAHPGAEKNPYPGQPDPVGPVACVKSNGVKVRAMTEEDMERIASDFASAAKFMVNAGFDGILIHGGHGFLFTQFLSPLYNKRTDEYGGCLENRAKFPIQILKAVRESIGPDKILDLRISGEDGLEGGTTAEDTGKFVHMLEGIIDSVHISGGVYTDPIRTHQFSSMYDVHGVNVDAAAIIKKYTSLPVGVIGGLNDPAQCEELLARGIVDYVILGRQMIADPEFPNKAKCGQDDLIRKCVRCFTCFPGSPEEGYTDIPMPTEELMASVGYCAINPQTGKPPLVMAEKKKKVLIIGGGVAGMQAAITAQKRGHEVILVEKSSVLGGMFNFTDKDVDKKDLRELKNTLIREVQSIGVDVRLNTEADASLIDCESPDALIVATGADMITPKIPGIEKARLALDVFYDYVPGKEIVLIGGGLVGCETALHLTKLGHTVTVVEMMDRLAPDAYGMYREAMDIEMEKRGVNVMIGTRCVSIGDHEVIVQQEDKQIALKCDSVLYSLGMRPSDTSAFTEYQDTMEVIKVGNCDVPGKIAPAIRGGYAAAVSI